MFIKNNYVIMCISKLCFAVYCFLKIFTCTFRPRFTGRRKKNTLDTINIVNVIYATLVKILYQSCCYSVWLICLMNVDSSNLFFNNLFILKQNNYFLTLRLFIFNTSWWHQKPENFSRLTERKSLKKYPNMKNCQENK